MKRLLFLSLLTILGLNVRAINTEVHTYEQLKTAISKVSPGDTIFLHEGTYTFTSQLSIKKDATEKKMIVISGYPGEAKPVLDCNHSASYSFYLCADYWHLKNLEVEHASHNGIRLEEANHCILENIILHNNDNTGLQIDNGSSYNIIKNCDSYHNVDASNEDGDGFAPKLGVGTGNCFYGCRSWENADDGYDGYMRGDVREITTYYDHCIAYRNGYINNATGKGDGNGFKLGGYDKDAPRTHNFIVTRCISAENMHKGFDRNSNVGSITLYNCSAFNNGIASADYNFAFPTGKDGTQQSGHTLTIKNCVSYSKDHRDYLMSCTPYVEDHNTWDLKGCALDDFKSTDATELISARNADGSLPDFIFMNLAKDSKLIDAGTDIGLDFNGTAPDLGWKEYTDKPTSDISSATAGDVRISHNDNAIIIKSDKEFPQAAIYDMSGKLITTHTGYTNYICFNVPKSDIYLVRIVINGKSYGYKIK